MSVSEADVSISRLGEILGQAAPLSSILRGSRIEVKIIRKGLPFLSANFRRYRSSALVSITQNGGD